MAILSPYAGRFSVTSVQGPRWGTTHAGMDLVGSDSKTVHSICTGVVTFVGWQGGNSSWSYKSIGGGYYNTQGSGYGYYVTIQDTASGKTVFYGHLQADSAKVANGQAVNIGTPIGVEGKTGNSTGEHLHLEIRPVVNHTSTPNYTNIPNSVGTYTSDLTSMPSPTGGLSVPVTSMKSADALAAGVKEGRYTIIDLRTSVEYDAYLGWPPYAGTHIDFTPIGEADSTKMLQCAGGQWNWKGRPCALKVEGRLIAIGIHSFPHSIIIGGGDYPASRLIGNGINSRNEYQKPAGGWPVGGHMCMYFQDSDGGTQGCKDAEKEAAGMSYTGMMSGGMGYPPLYATHNTRKDATMREVGYLDSSYKPSIYMSAGRPKLTVINYTSMLSAMFQGGSGTSANLSYDSTFDGDIEAEAKRNSQRIYQFFSTQLGLADNNICGILGNWYHESRIDPTAVETIYSEPFKVDGPKKQAAASVGYMMSAMNPGYSNRFPRILRCGLGLGQWTDVKPGPGGRNTMLRNFATQIGKGWWQLETQLLFLSTPESEGGDVNYRVNWLRNWSPEASPSSAANSFLKQWEGMNENTWGTVDAAGRRSKAERFYQDLATLRSPVI